MPDTAPQTHGPLRKTLANIWKNRLALVITLLFVLGNVGLEHTPLGRWLQFQAFSGLHALMLPAPPEPLPVVVVDIDELPSYEGHATSHKDLQSLIDAIADQKPAAIGLDIDFSPQENAPQSPADQAFFDFCLDLTQGKRDDNRKEAPIPVFLGVHRTLFEPPEYWLGDPEYNTMAAAISMPPGDTRRLPRWFAGDGTGLRSLSEALAESYLSSRGETMPGPGRLAPFVETMPLAPHEKRPQEVGGVEEELAAPAPPGFRVGLSPVNFSRLAQLQSERVRVNLREGKAMVSGDFGGRIVLLGDASTRDVFTDPGPVQPFRGVYLHACAAYTDIEKPLYELREGVRIALDVALSLVLVAVLAGQEAHDEAGQRRRQWRQFWVLGAAFVLGWLLVLGAGILWLDFLAILLALLLHPLAELHAEPLWEKLEERFHSHEGKRHAEKHRADHPAPAEEPSEIPPAAALPVPADREEETP